MAEENVGGPAAAAAGAGGAFKFKINPGIDAFYQGDRRWAAQKLNAAQKSDNNLHVKGCLLSAIASAFAWKGVRIPGPDVDSVKKLLSTKNASYALPPNLLTPATLEAWMSLNAGQGYEGAGYISLNAGRLSRITTDPTLAYWGCHSADVKVRYLRLPTAADLRTWINDKHILIARPTFNSHHWLWIIGHDGKERFLVWDAGYPAGHADHTDALTVDKIERLNHWGRLPGSH